MASLDFFFNQPNNKADELDQLDNHLEKVISEFIFIGYGRFFIKALIIFTLALIYMVTLRWYYSPRKPRIAAGYKLPIRSNHSRQLFIGKSADEKCSICLEGLESESEVVVLSQCEHVFHVPCVAKWTEKNRSCPVCRRIVDELLVSIIIPGDDHHNNQGLEIV